MWPDSRRFAGIINILQHEGTAAVRGSTGKGWVMHRENHRTAIILAFHTGERRLQEINWRLSSVG